LRTPFGCRGAKPEDGITLFLVDAGNQTLCAALRSQPQAGERENDITLVTLCDMGLIRKYKKEEFHRKL